MNNDPPASPGDFIFGHSPNINGSPHVGIGGLPAMLGLFAARKRVARVKQAQPVVFLINL